MSATLMRLGLYTLVVVLGLFIVREAYPNSPVAELASYSLLYQCASLSIVVLVAGLVLRMFDKTKSAVVKRRCSVCRAPVPQGAIYCRAHLREVLTREEDLRHSSIKRR